MSQRLVRDAVAALEVGVGGLTADQVHTRICLPSHTGQPFGLRWSADPGVAPGRAGELGAVTAP